MNTDTKVLNKILAKGIQQHIKKLTHHDQVGFIQEWKDYSVYANQSMWYTILPNWKIKKQMIVSIDAEKAFDKIQHPFMIKTLQKMGIEKTYLDIV